MEQQERNPMFFRFEDLRIYDKALEYVLWVKENVIDFPEKEKDFLSTQFVNTSQNIAINIAEGSGRNKSQFVYYLKMAKSAIRECLVLTTLSTKLGYLNAEQEDKSRTELMEMTKMLGALISSLQRSAANRNNERTPRPTERHNSYQSNNEMEMLDDHEPMPNGMIPNISIDDIDI